MANDSQPEAIPLEPTLTTPDKASLSKTTTVVDSSTPRHSASEQLKNPFETDIEAVASHTYSSDGQPRRSSIILNRRNDQQVWPGKNEWKQRAKASKASRTGNWCAPMARMSKRNKIITKVLILLLIVGIAVGVGFGVSKPLGAPIWGKPHS